MFASKNVRLYVVVLLIASLLVACGGTASATPAPTVPSGETPAAPEPTTGQPAQPAPTSEPPATLEPPAEGSGETDQQTANMVGTAEIGSLTLTINEVTYPAGEQFNMPSPGYKFLVVDTTIENKGTYDEPISSLLQMWLEDASGQKYNVDFMATAAANGTPPDGEIPAGEQVRGQVGFQVPEDATGLVFVFAGDLVGGDTVSVPLR